MRTHEIFNIKHKKLDLKIEIDDAKGYVHHNATILGGKTIKRRVNANIERIMFINVRRLKKGVA